MDDKTDTMEAFLIAVSERLSEILTMLLQFINQFDRIACENSPV